MKLTINGERSAIPPEQEQEMIRGILEELKADYYKKLPQHWRVAAKPFTRAMLLMLEKEAEKKGGIEAARAIRPPRNADPNIYLGEILAGILLKGLEYVNLRLDICEGTISAVKLDFESPRQAGGSLDSDRHVGLRENDGSQVS